MKDKELDGVIKQVCKKYHIHNFFEDCVKSLVLQFIEERKLNNNDYIQPKEIIKGIDLLLFFHSNCSQHKVTIKGDVAFSSDVSSLIPQLGEGVSRHICNWYLSLYNKGCRCFTEDDSSAKEEHYNRVDDDLVRKIKTSKSNGNKICCYYSILTPQNLNDLKVIVNTIDKFYIKSRNQNIGRWAYYLIEISKIKKPTEAFAFAFDILYLANLIPHTGWHDGKSESYVAGTNQIYTSTNSDKADYIKGKIKCYKDAIPFIIK